MKIDLDKIIEKKNLGNRRTRFYEFLHTTGAGTFVVTIRKKYKPEPKKQKLEKVFEDGRIKYITPA